MTKEETKSCIGTIEMLQRLAYNIHGVMDVIDADNCKKIIKALEQEPRWISCSEKLPNEKEISEEERNEWVLVTIECSQKPVEVMHYLGTRIGQRDVGNGWEEYEYPAWTSGHGDIKSSHPKAWMPLPKRYGEVEK